MLKTVREIDSGSPSLPRKISCFQQRKSLMPHRTIISCFSLLSKYISTVIIDTYSEINRRSSKMVSGYSLRLRWWQSTGKRAPRTFPGSSGMISIITASLHSENGKRFSYSLHYTISTTNASFSSPCSTGMIFHIDPSLHFHHSTTTCGAIYHPSLKRLLSGEPTLSSLKESLLETPPAPI